MNTIFINDLIVFTTIGIYNWEKSIKQKLILDISMKWNNSMFNKTYNINDCLNYENIAKYLESYLYKNKFLLIETVAEKISDIILYKFNSYFTTVKVTKPNALYNAKEVGIIIHRNKELDE
ncbi:Dihydroneopterin aldolase [Buchnera aphidicola (Neophyllaphis podocarpi)]|uniref:dihydroneopterin aldolase n=1 Tax=Buchnera aphidicola TaxID=9 RepID=UPI0031B844C9